MRKNKWQIPYKSGTGDYARAFMQCRLHGKTYPELTDKEKTRDPSKKAPKTPIKISKEIISTAGSSSEVLINTIVKLTEEITVLSLEVLELRMAFRRAKKEHPPIS